MGGGYSSSIFLAYFLYLVVLLHQMGLWQAVCPGQDQLLLDQESSEKRQTIMSRDYLDAIVHCYVDGRNEFKKYQKIKNVEDKLQKFETFARSRFPAADYVNYYWRHLPDGSNYAFRRYLTPKEAVS